MGRAQRITAVLARVGLAVVVALAICSLSNAGITRLERKKNPAPGVFFANNGSDIHVLVRGSGGRNVVLLSGWGTPSPIYDFMPLIRELEKEFTVCVVELNGYGWSERTKKPRTNENIMNEIRGSLRAAGIDPPYILIPHSIAGIYSLYYANKHPEEIGAIVGLDSSVPEQVKYSEEQNIINWYDLLRNLGLVRVALTLRPDYFKYDENVYDRESIKKLNMFACWNTDNATVWNEGGMFIANAREVLGLRIPKSIPCRMLLSDETIARTRKKSVLDWVEEHEKLIQGNANGSVLVLEGGHYIHRNNSRAILEIVKGIR